MTDHDVKVVDNPDEGQFEIYAHGRRAGFVAYDLAPDRITFIHTEIDPEFNGRGLGGRLVAQALDMARERGLAVVPRCPFVKRFIERHPDYADLVAA
ncbi:MAG TPA: GNAT family N-acetyltransferase [Rugosimonospora sp.]|nr:GNAT family N-acetyltransferase [Rugosimonospora sp.]